MGSPFEQLEVNQNGAAAEPRRLFVAFEGGGAKALVHVGALKALERRGFAFKGLAGTSAGAIVAALKAVGYQADELVDPQNRRTVLDENNNLARSPAAKVLGRRAALMIVFLRFFSAQANRHLLLFVYSTILAALFLLTALPDSFWHGLGNVAEFYIITTIFVFLLLKIFIRTGGMVSARSFRNFFNDLLFRKLFGPVEQKRDVLLRDLNNGDHPCLRIVAADITARQLRLFSSDAPEDQDLAIADVVTASMCIPFLFTPWMIGDRHHVDGGIVSNLPAWPFDEERELDFDAMTIACEICDGQPRRHPSGLDGWFQNLVQTALFGSSILNKRGVQRLEVISLATRLGLLDFDLTRQQTFDVVREATAAADAIILRQLINRPAVYEEACVRLRAVVRPLLENIPDALANPNVIGRSRVALAFPQAGYPQSLRLTYSAGFENDADEGIVLPRTGTVIGEAWNDRSYVLLTPPMAPLTAPGLRRLIKLFAKDIAWIFAVPIFVADRDEPAFIVAIDGSDVLAEDDAVQDKIIDVLSAEVERAFSPLAAELEQL